jgi:hypothetical protein
MSTTRSTASGMSDSRCARRTVRPQSRWLPHVAKTDDALRGAPECLVHEAVAVPRCRPGVVTIKTLTTFQGVINNQPSPLSAFRFPFSPSLKGQQKSDLGANSIALTLPHPNLSPNLSIIMATVIKKLIITVAHGGPGSVNATICFLYTQYLGSTTHSHQQALHETRPTNTHTHTHTHTRECLDPRTAEAQKTNLQIALHAHACSSRCTLSVIRSGTRYEKWAGGSRSQTHRRAAMCGFTQHDGYVRGVAPTHERSSGSFLDFLLATSASLRASRERVPERNSPYN